MGESRNGIEARDPALYEASFTGDELVNDAADTLINAAVTFTITVPGRYLVGFSFHGATIGGNLGHASIYVNSTKLTRTERDINGAFNAGFAATAIQDLVAGDVVQVRARNDGGGSYVASKILLFAARQ